MPNIILYTAHHCPFAHRAQIALRELELPFKEELIDITVPRTKEYLAINPNGMVPALSYDGKIFTESSLISQFLLDLHPGHLLRGSTEASAPFERFQMGYFTENFFSKVHPLFDAIVYADGIAAKDAALDKYIEGVIKYIEPLLQDAAPFFGAAMRPTFVEVLSGPFLLRVLNYPKYEALVPARLLGDLQQTAPRFWEWAQAVIREPSVLSVWDETLVVNKTLDKIKQKRQT